MSYERFTEFKPYKQGESKGRYVQYCVTGCYNDMNRKGDYTTGASVDRLAELKNKIERGTLIELPCRVGDTVYVPWVWDDQQGISTAKIEEIKFYDSQMHYMCFINLESDNESFNQEFGGWKIDQSIGETVFLACEDAEKRLKELTGRY